MNDFNALAIVALSLTVVLAIRLGPMSKFRERPLVSAYNTFLLLFFTYVCFSGSLSVVFNGGDFTWAPADSDPALVAAAIGVSALSLVLFLIGYRGGLSRRPTINAHVEYAVVPGINIAWACVFAGLLLKVYLIYAGGGVSGSLLRLSGGIRESLRLEALDPVLVNLRTLSGIADAGASWIVLIALKRRTGRVLAAAIFALVVALSFFSIGKRLVLVWPMLCVLLGYHFYVRRLTIALLPAGVLLLFAFGAGSLFFRIFLPAQVAAVSIDLRAVPWAGGSLLNFYVYSLEFSTFEMLTVCIGEAERVVGMFGGALDAFVTTNIVPLFFAVPRLLWPGKPDIFLDVSHALLSIITGVPLEKATAGTAGTLIGVSWAFGGFFWLTAVMLLFGALCAKIDQPVLHVGVISPTKIVTLAFGINLVLHIFRQGTLGWIFIITVVQQYGMIAAFLAIAFIGAAFANRKRPNRALPGQPWRSIPDESL